MEKIFDLLQISWGSRREAPQEIADRLLKIINNFRRLDPAFQDWRWLETIRIVGEEDNGRLRPLDESPYVLSSAIEHNVNCEPYRTYIPDHNSGYFFYLATGRDYTPNYFQVSGTVANTYSSFIPAFANETEVSFVTRDALPPIVTFDLTKSLLLITAETWEASSGIAFSSGEFDMALAGKAFKWGWMTYLSPYFATRIEPPTGIVLEYRPNGGLFMAATTDVFDPNNPIHYDAAQRIRRALEPLNALPFPVDQPYR